MSVVFDIFFFNKQYLKEVRKKEAKESHSLDPNVELEVGAISCRNTDRKQPIYFYDVEELAELLEAAYAIGNDREANEQLVGTDAFPPDSVIPAMIELDKPVAGRFIDPDGNDFPFANRADLASVIEGQLPER